VRAGIRAGDHRKAHLHQEPSGLITYYTHFVGTGELACLQDPNQQLTMQTHDTLGLSITTTYPFGGAVTVSYNGDAVALNTTTTRIAGPSPSVP
jgi:hypothetical protein